MLQSCAESDSEKMNNTSDDAAPLIGVAVVIYNKECSESVSFMKLMQMSLPVLLLVDNSTDAEILRGNRQYSISHNCEYYSMGVNAGLSKAYNAAIDLLQNRIEYLMILDDDTAVPDDAVSLLSKAITENPGTDIFVPYVADQKCLLSPCRRVSSLFFRLHRRPDSFTPGMSAINSGMVLRLGSGSLAGFRAGPGTGINTIPHFDEGQFLDCIDHLFVFQQRKSGAKIHLYPAEFKQAFFDQAQAGEDRTFGEGQAGSKAGDRRGILDNQEEKTLVRFRLFVKDYRYFYRKCSLSSFVSELYLLFRAAKLNLRYRTFRFFPLLEKSGGKG